MQIQSIFIFALVSVTGASYTPIAGYKPGSKVTSHNAIDLDQFALENYLLKSTVDYTGAKNVYEQGGNSKSYAEFSVPPLTQALKKGDAVKGKTSGKTGSVYSNYVAKSNVIKVAYSTSDTQTSYVACKVGQLEAAPQGTTPGTMQPYQLKTGCFSDGEDIEITTDVNGQSTKVVIKPLANAVNKAGRTLKGFSTKAAGTMRVKGSNGGCSGASDRPTDGCPYKDFMEYYNYYGNDDYANKMVLAALDKKFTSFAKTSGNMDFSSSSDAIRTQIVKKGTAYMNAYMYAIREFEDAIDDCKAGCKNGKDGNDAGKDCNALSANAVHAWDEGVAFYTGSLEGANAGGHKDGKMSYRLAEKRCGNFKTCGPNGGSTSGTSMVNTELFKQLDIGQNYLLTGKCDETRPVLRKMVALMAVPLIQGTLRYAYKVDKLGGGDKEKAEGAIFAAAIVPRVNACNAADAAKIMNNMKMGATSTSFAIVKAAFENNYKCMEIQCQHVGGLWFSAQNKYYDGAQPCGDYWKTKDTSGSTTSEVTSQSAPHSGILSVGNVVILLIACFCFLQQ